MTKADQKRLDIIHRLPCLACVQDGSVQPSATEAHHIVDKGYRKHSGGHQSTLPLCKYHHRGETPLGFTVDEMHFTHGPSMFHHGKEFKQRYGTQRELLDRVNGLIAK